MDKAAQELADTERTKAEDKQYLEDLTAECAQKAQEFEARVMVSRFSYGQRPGSHGYFQTQIIQLGTLMFKVEY